jgi:hypothetical protein
LCYISLLLSLRRRIFGQKRLDVVKLPDSKLAILVVVLVAFDVIILGLWSGLAPLQAMPVTRAGATNITVYQHCTASDAGAKYAIVMVSTKAALLMFGCLMAFGMSQQQTPATANAHAACTSCACMALPLFCSPLMPVAPLYFALLGAV